VGRIDLLVNNVWAGYERWGERRFDAKFWEQPLWRYDLCFDSLRAHYVCTQLAAPMLLDAPRGLVVTIGYTDGPTYLGQVAYDVAKHAADRMVVALAHDLARTDVVALGLHPGFVRTERVDGAAEHLIGGPATIVHSPEYVGRAVAHLAADPDLGPRAGTVVAVGDLADVYGFDDVDGRRPAAFRLEGRRTLANRMEKLHQAAAGPSRGDGT
jgi:NAD(P)-dependent dehydrogenase (short-subunit alcohol dehydrogenase family)